MFSNPKAAASLTGLGTLSTVTPTLNYTRCTRNRAERLRIALMRSDSYAFCECPAHRRTYARRIPLRVELNKFRRQSVNVHGLQVSEMGFLAIGVLVLECHLRGADNNVRVLMNNLNSSARFVRPDGRMTDVLRLQNAVQDMYLNVKLNLISHDRLELESDSDNFPLNHLQ